MRKFGLKPKSIYSEFLVKKKKEGNSQILILPAQTLG